MLKAKSALNRRILVLLLAVCLIAPFLGTTAFSLSSIHHHCTGHTCPICRQILEFFAILTALEALPAVIGFAWLRDRTISAQLRYPVSQTVIMTPISLCVRMNN